MSLHGNWFHLRIRWSQYQHWHLISYVSLPAWLRQIYLAVLMATSSLVLGSIVAGYVFILSVENFKFVMLFFAFSCYSCCSCELEWPHLRHSLTIHNDPHDTLVHFFEVIQGQRMQHSWTTFNHQQPQNWDSDHFYPGWWTLTSLRLQALHLKVPWDGNRDHFLCCEWRMKQQWLAHPSKVFSEKVKWAICHTSQ